VVVQSDASSPVFAWAASSSEKSPESPRHAAFGGHAVVPDIPPGGGEASGIAGHVVAVNKGRYL